ncbi:MAG: type 4a pilus biogenesis protein PilO [Nitrospirales bacterium]|nr:type 4a pilus biogenesis protein PilO [Nitrospirales bacterium]
MKLKIDPATLTPLQKWLLAALPSVLIVALGVVFLILPAMQELGRLSDEVAAQEKEIAVAKKRTEKLSVIRAENERLQKRLQDLQAQLPEEKEVSGLLRQVSELGIKSGLQVIAWKPAARRVHASKEVYEIPVDVEMRGLYHSFGEFAGNVTKLSRIVNVLNITMKAAEVKGKAMLSVGFNALTYSIIPEKERKQLEQEQQK